MTTTGACAKEHSQRRPHSTGKEHDSESGNDYFGARYYASTMGRWLMPDPSGLSYSDPSDPQSLNLYAYVGNHALQYVDPYGTYYDQGTITATISGTPVSINFGACSTPAGLASSLASAINTTAGSFVSATATGQTISLTSINGGVSTDWSLSSSVTFDTVDFGSPSYAVSTSTNMSGGSDSSNGVVYSFTVPDAGGFDSNGNLLSVTDSVLGQWNYSYDNLNRLVGGSAVAGQYSGKTSAWSYDPFGNRTSETTPYGSTTAAYAAPRNQVTSATSATAGFTYDAAGNVTNDGFNQYLYDAEGRVCAVNNFSGVYTGYFYDADGTRVAKGNLAQFSCTFTLANFTPTHSYVLGPGGEQVTELTVSGSPGSYASSWLHTNVFGSMGLLASYAWSNTPNQSSTYFALNDWLGTKRAEVGAEGCVATFTGMPFGNDVLPAGNCPDATEHHFTGKERDTESGNDYFGARYYGSSMGRFLSPDPMGIASGSLANPQSLNLYAYALNNPLINFDPDGRECVWDDGSYDSADDPDTGSADKCSGQGGTWIGHDVFANSQYYRGDWSGDANDTLGGLVGQIQSCSAAVGGGQGASLLIADAFASGFSNDMTAYTLATALHESGPDSIGQQMTESGGSAGASYFNKYNGILGNTSNADAFNYRGRGYIQITGKQNYQTWSNELGVNFVANPNLAAVPDNAAQIAVEGLDRGSFTGVSLYNYVNPGGTDFVNARKTVNGLDDAKGIASSASSFASTLSGCR